MEKPDKPVLLAVIGAAHGIRGEVRVKSFTGDPVALRDYGTLFDADGRSFDVDSIRPQQDVVVVRFKGIADRTAAERLNGTELFALAATDNCSLNVRTCRPPPRRNSTMKTLSASVSGMPGAQISAR